MLPQPPAENPAKKRISDSLQEKSRSLGQLFVPINLPNSLLTKENLSFVMPWHGGCSRLLKELQNFGDKLSATNFAAREFQEAVTMTIGLPKKATLGDLIAAVTDEIAPLTRCSANTNLLVSYIVTDLFAKRRVRLKRRRVLKIA